MSPRTRILDAAMLVFRRQGFRRSSIEQAAEAAGLTRQALYHHFESKEALFRAVIERLHEEALAAEIAAASAAEKRRRQPCRHPGRVGQRQARATGRLARRLAPCRGTVFRTSAAGPRPLPEIHHRLCRAACGNDRARLPQTGPHAQRHDAARFCTAHRDGDQRHQIRLSGDAAGRRFPEGSGNHAAHAGGWRREPGAAEARGEAEAGKEIHPPRKPGDRR